MADSKTVTVMKPGGGSSAVMEIVPGDNAVQVCTLVAPQLGEPPDGRFQLLGANKEPIMGDVYKAVKDGDILTLASTQFGG